MSAPEELTDAQLAELRADAEAALAEIAQLLDNPSDRTATVDLDQPIGRVSRIDALQQQKMAQEQKRRHGLRRSQLIAAIQRHDDGEYGDCRACEEPIGYARLKARPETPLCVECKQAAERRR